MNEGDGDVTGWWDDEGDGEEAGWLDDEDGVGCSRLTGGKGGYRDFAFAGSSSGTEDSLIPDQARIKQS